MKNEIWGVYTIYSSMEEFELSANVDFTTGYYMPNLTFSLVQSKEYPDQKLCWDNPDFLYGKFTRFLQRFFDKSLKKKDKKNYKDIWHILNDESCQELLDMLEKSKEMGWDKLK